LAYLALFALAGTRFATAFSVVTRIAHLTLDARSPVIIIASIAVALEVYFFTCRIKIIVFVKSRVIALTGVKIITASA